MSRIAVAVSVVGAGGRGAAMAGALSQPPGVLAVDEIARDPASDAAAVAMSPSSGGIAS